MVEYFDNIKHTIKNGSKKEIQELLRDETVKKYLTVDEYHAKMLDPEYLKFDDILEEFSDLFQLANYSYVSTNYENMKINMSSKRYEIVFRYFVEINSAIRRTKEHAIRVDTIDGADPKEYYNSDKFMKMIEEIYKERGADKCRESLLPTMGWILKDFNLETSKKFISVIQDKLMLTNYIELIAITNQKVVGFYLYENTYFSWGSPGPLMFDTFIDRLLESELTEEMALKFITRKDLVLVDKNHKELSYRLVGGLIRPLKDKPEHYESIREFLERIVENAPLLMDNTFNHENITLEELKGFYGNDYAKMSDSMRSSVLKTFYIDNLDEVLSILMIQMESKSPSEKRRIFWEVNPKTLMDYIDPSIRLLLL